MARMARITPVTVNTATRATATGLPMRIAAIMPTFAASTTHAPPVTAVFMETRPRGRAVRQDPGQLGRDTGGDLSQLRVGARRERLADQCVEFVPGQPTLHDRGLEQADHPPAVGTRGPQGRRGRLGSRFRSHQRLHLYPQRNPAAGRPPCPGCAVPDPQARRVAGAAACRRAGLTAPGLGCVALGLMLDRLALPALPVLRGERAVLRDFVASDVDDRLRHPIDPEEEDGYGSSWRREWDGERYHTREHLLTTRPPPQPGAYEWAVEHDGHCVGSAGLRVDADQHGASYTVGLFVAGLHGQGLGREITRLVLSRAFGVLGVHRVELEVLAFNRRAISCYLACGVPLGRR